LETKWENQDWDGWKMQRTICHSLHRDVGETKLNRKMRHVL